MIRIGLEEKQKQYEITKYVNEHSGIKEIIVFSDKRFFMNLPDVPCHVRQIDYDETIMYRTFYPLLEEIDDTYLLVVNEMMRTRNRSDLHYNCVQKYTNQTPHRLVFEYLPIIEEEKDFMVLLDFATSQQYKGQGLADIDLSQFDIQCVRRKFTLEEIPVPLPLTAQALYEAERDKLFENLGNKHPDTIPRNLHLWTGRFKTPCIDADKNYVARNSRFKMNNITVYKNAVENQDYILIDIPHRRLDFNDFLRRTRQVNLKYLSTGFSVDRVYVQEFKDWTERLERIYAQTGIYPEIR